MFGPKHMNNTWKSYVFQHMKNIWKTYAAIFPMNMGPKR